MTWFDPPDVEQSTVGEAQVWRLLGDWTRDLPLEVKHRAASLLRTETPGPLVLDLGDIKFLDSWGEEAIADLLQRLVEANVKLAWVFDGVRSASYQGVRESLLRRRLTIASFSEQDEAVASLVGAT